MTTESSTKVIERSYCVPSANNTDDGTAGYMLISDSVPVDNSGSVRSCLFLLAGAAILGIGSMVRDRLFSHYR